MPGSITFVLKEPTKIDPNSGNRVQMDDDTLIYLIFRYKDLKIKVSTNEKVLPKYWNKEKCRIRAVSDFPEYRFINKNLDNHQINAMDAVSKHIEKNGIIKPDILKSEITEAIRPGIEKPEVSDFFKAFDEFIKVSAVTKTTGTIVTYEVNKKALKEFSDTRKKPISYDDISLKFRDDYIKWMIEVRKFAPNTQGNRIKTLKTFMNYALSRGYTNNTAHRDPKFTKPHEETESFYLTDDEIQKLYNYDLTERKSHERVRDIFVFGCYTGLRYSDLMQFHSDMIKDGDKIEIKTKKTKEVVIIPMHETVIEILKKYKNQLPTISDQAGNRYLKEIAKDAGLDGTVTSSKAKGKLSVISERTKSNKIGFHTARRSFATNAYLKDIPTIEIMLMTGHKTETAFMKYIKITKEENANKLKYHEFFKKSPLKIAK